MFPREQCIIKHLLFVDNHQDYAHKISISICVHGLGNFDDFESDLGSLLS